MDEFFNQLKHNLEGKEDPVVDPQAWSRMAKKLQQAQRRRRAVGWWWFAIAGALILALGAGNVILASQLAGAKKAFKTTDPTPTSRIDTVFRDRTVVHVDTIYLDRTIIERVSLESTVATSDQSSPRTTQVGPGTGPADEAEPSLMTTDIVLAGNSEKSETTRDGRSPVTLAGLSHMNRNLLVLPDRFLPRTTAPQLQLIVRGRKQRLSDFLRPKAFEAGAYFESNTTFLSDVVSEDGYGIGAEFAMYFSRRWQLWVGYHYMQLRYRALQMGDALDIPVVNSPLEDFAFTETNVTIPAWQVNVGVSYQFQFGQYKPYLGAGIATSRVLERALIYRYEDELRDLDLSLRYEIPGSEFANEQWLLRAGMDYAFGRHWSLNIEGNFRSGLQPSSPRTLRILGLRSGIYYIF